MNAVPRTRALVAALGALVLLTVGACSSADSDQATSTAASVTSGASQTVSDGQVSDGPVSDTAAENPDGSDNVLPPATTDPSAPESSESIPANTELPPAPDPATTEVPAPGGGNIDETVAESTVTTNPPVAVTDTADYGNGVTASLTKTEKLTTTAELPGEIAGPGVALTVRLVNDSDAPIDLGVVVVDLQDAAGTPAIPMTTSPAAPMTGSLAPGASADGTYVFTLPSTYTGPATVSVSYTVDAPVVVFTGDLA
ncbi:hypothetical protein [Nakamurella deserti]|uniref:hypothetical protein n=1 Tax=Nakamurella deserti TaxID=2164074 RepID=UPI000DBE3108|nr:hypothetical protein [Nakamurella deserti]